MKRLLWFKQLMLVLCDKYYLILINNRRGLDIMKFNYKVSIIVPVYKAEEFLDRCLKSLVEQTYKNIEIICVLDGLNIQCEKIINDYIERGYNVLIHKQANQGAIYSRKVGFGLSTGDFVMFVDSDDWIDIQTVERCMHYIEKNNLDLLRFGYSNVLNDKILKTNLPSSEVEVFVGNEAVKNKILSSMFTNYDFNQMCGQIIKKKCICESFFNLQLIVAEDLFFNFLLTNNINSMALYNKSYYYYYRNMSSITKKISLDRLKRDIENITFVYKEILEAYKSANQGSIVNMQKAYKFIYKELIFYMFKSLSLRKINRNEKINFIKEQSDSDFYILIKRNLSFETIKSEKNGYKIIFILMYKNHVTTSYIFGNMINTLVHFKEICLLKWGG